MHPTIFTGYARWLYLAGGTRPTLLLY